MSQRAICYCPLCLLERRVISRLEQEDSVLWFQQFRARTPSLEGFSTITELISFAHSVKGDPDKRRICDGAYVALLQELKAGNNPDLVQSVLLRMLAPGLHKELRKMIVANFPGLDRNDLTQQWITKCLQIMHSRGILAKTSYLAASIIEWTKRDMFRWAPRQKAIEDQEEMGVVIDDVFETPLTEIFESERRLRELIDKAVTKRLISAKDAELLIAYEIEGMTGEELGKRVGLDPKALSHRVRRALERLQQAFNRPAKGKSDLPKGPPE